MYNCGQFEFKKCSRVYNIEKLSIYLVFFIFIVYSFMTSIENNSMQPVREIKRCLLASRGCLV